MKSFEFHPILKRRACESQDIEAAKKSLIHDLEEEYPFYPVSIDDWNDVYIDDVCVGRLAQINGSEAANADNDA